METKIIQAKYLGNYTIEIHFNNGVSKTIDFKEFLFSAEHECLILYQNKENFQKFTIENGNIVWGEDWDLIFPIDDLLSGDIGTFHQQKELELSQ